MFEHWLRLAVTAAWLVVPSNGAAQTGATVRDQNTSGAPQRAVKTTPTAASTHAAEGMAALEKQDYAGAIAQFEKALEANPGDVPSRFYLALSLSLSRQDAASLPHYEKLVETQPEVYELRLNYAQALVNTSHFEEAAEQLAKAEEIKPSQPKTVSLLVATGKAELAEGDDAGARKRFEAALRIDPAQADALAGLGTVCLSTGDLEAAETWFRKAVAARPEYRKRLLDLAEAWEAKGNFAKAASLYGEFPDDAQAQARAGELLLRAGSAKEAIAALEASVKEKPDFENRRTLAVAYLRSGDTAKAAATMQAAVDSEPQNAEAHLAYGRILRDARRFVPAAEQFGIAIKLKPDDTMAWSEFAGVAVLAEQYQAALQALAQLEKLGGLKPGHHYLRAIILDKFRNYKEAIAEYELFLAASAGQNKDEEFKARQRLRILQRETRR
ncbi:MAG: tetratricopeptide repeat protein [Bryobacterales bacterium]|nr:tetratricopeptide repeat protein [Bryobacterales bacterium]